MLRLNASDLAEATLPATPNPRKKHVKSVPVSLEFDQVSGSLSITEAKFGTFGKRIPASGDWPEPVQVDCVLLAPTVQGVPLWGCHGGNCGPRRGDHTHRRHNTSYPKV